MQDRVDRIIALVGKSFRNELTHEEKVEFENWLAESEANRTFLKNVSNEQFLLEEMMQYKNIDIKYGPNK